MPAPSPLLADVVASSTALAALPDGNYGRICRLGMGETEQAWLAALGLPIGETVTVVRRAPWRGPLHVRTGTGAEFALDRSCAAEIHVVPCDASTFLHP